MISKKIFTLMFAYLMCYSKVVCMQSDSVENIIQNPDTSGIHTLTLTLEHDFAYKDEDIKNDMELIRDNVFVGDFDGEHQLIECPPFRIKFHKEIKDVNDIIPHLTRMYKIYTFIVDCNSDDLNKEKFEEYKKHDCIMIDTRVFASNRFCVEDIIRLYYNEYLSTGLQEMLSEIDESEKKMLECCYVLDNYRIVSQDIVTYIYSILKDTEISPYSDIDGASYECFKLMETYILNNNLANNLMIRGQIFKYYVEALIKYIAEVLYFALN